MRGLYRPSNSLVWHLDYVTADGKRRRESSGTRDRSAALALLSERRAKSAAGETQPKRQLLTTRLSEIAERYMAANGHLRSAPWRRATLKRLVRVLGDPTLAAITPQALEEYTAARLAQGKQPSTCNRDADLIKSVVDYAARVGMVPIDHAQRLHRVKWLPERPRIRYLTSDELRALLGASTGELRAAIVVAVNTGLRRGELFGLTWERVDLVARRLTVTADGAKNGQARAVPLNAAAVAALRTLRSSHALVFCHGDGTKRRRWMLGQFATACRRAGLCYVSWHTLRHTFISHMVMSGADLFSVAELAGHRSLRMTQRYAHLAPSHKAALVERLYRASPKR